MIGKRLLTTQRRGWTLVGGVQIVARVAQQIKAGQVVGQVGIRLVIMGEKIVAEMAIAIARSEFARRR